VALVSASKVGAMHVTPVWTPYFLIKLFLIVDEGTKEVTPMTVMINITLLCLPMKPAG
jgi:hypothetical protein